jgi:DNA-binding transcriptional regulator WhiA
MIKELAYLLGYFYADGCLSSKTIEKKYNKGFSTYYRLTLEIVSTDCEYIKYCLNKLNIDFSIRSRMRKNSNHEQTCFTISTKNELFEVFKNVLSDKTDMSKAFDYIELDYYPYFLRGFFDGDGCIAISKRNVCRLYFYGNYSQLWDSIFKILTFLDIKYTYQQISRKNGNHKSSHVVISNKEGINKLFEFIYPNRIFDFGLYRKFEKLNKVSETIKNVYIRHSCIQIAPSVKIYN